MGTELYRQKRTAEGEYLSIWECIREKVTHRVSPSVRVPLGFVCDVHLDEGTSLSESGKNEKRDKKKGCSN